MNRLNKIKYLVVKHKPSDRKKSVKAKILLSVLPFSANRGKKKIKKSPKCKRSLIHLSVLFLNYRKSVLRGDIKKHEINITP